MTILNLDISIKKYIKILQKINKWGFNYLRLLRLKLRFGKAFHVNIFCKKPAYIGRDCKVKISGSKGEIFLGAGSYFDDYCLLNADNGVIKVDENSYFNTYCRLVAKKFVKIGKNCMFGTNVSVYDHDHDISNGVISGHNKYVKKSVMIGDGVWCCTNVVVTSGCIIENNCVIGANAVVTKNIVQDSFCVGTPAKYIKSIRTL